MATIHLSTFIKAPVAVVFDLARSIELHTASTAQTNEIAIAGRTSGLCEADDTITWQATHFGIRQLLTVRITKMEPPHLFEDEMVKGAFSSFNHQHIFEAQDDGTLMKDVFTFKAPLGILGTLAEKLFLTRYMTRLLMKRNAVIREVAESGKIIS